MSKTERKRRQGKMNDVEGPICEGVHTRYIERPSAANGKEECQSRRRSDPRTPLLERFETIELERRSVAWMTLDLAMNAFWKDRVSLGDWQKNERGRPVTKMIVFWPPNY